METKKNIFREHLGAWFGAGKIGRGKIVGNICVVAKMHPKLCTP